MFAKLRSHFGIPGVIAVFALVFAMFGGAYAANNSGGGASASAKAKKGPPGPRGKQGKQGKQGLPGPAGAKGDTGATGATGSTGAAGKDGTPGPPGAPGKGAKATPLLAGAQLQCEETGGALVEDGQEPPNKVPVCNGKDGSPWTAGGTLPPGSTETGAWVIGTDSSSGVFGSFAMAPISFTVPLATPLPESQVYFQSDTGFSDHCHGSEAAPQADPGYLCVYETPATLTNLSSPGIYGLEFGGEGASKGGALLIFTIEGDEAYGFGGWAVTGCSGTTGPTACPA